MHRASLNSAVAHLYAYVDNCTFLFRVNRCLGWCTMKSSIFVIWNNQGRTCLSTTTKVISLYSQSWHTIKPTEKLISLVFIKCYLYPDDVFEGRVQRNVLTPIIIPIIGQIELQYVKTCFQWMSNFLTVYYNLTSIYF